MADETQNLQIVLSASDAGAVAMLTDIRAHITGIEAELRTMSAESASSGAQMAAGMSALRGAAAGAGPEIANVARSTRGAGDEIERATAKLGPFGGFIADASEHSRQFSSALDAMGLKSTAAAERASGLGQILVGLGDAAPQIIAISVAVATLAATFEFTKGAIDDAAELEQAMTLLGQSVRNQGGDWQSLQGSVEQFAETQERTTIFSNTEVVKSLNQLAAAGVSVKDAMTIVRVAEDAAAATGHSLTDVVHGLMEAEAGRTQILASLGIATRAQIKDGMSLDDVLRLIEQHMGGEAAAAADTYQGALSTLSATWEHLLQDIGSPFLTALADVALGFTDVVRAVDDEAKPSLEELSQWFTQHQSDIGAFFNQLKTAALDLGTDFREDIVPAAQELWSALGDVGHALNDVSRALTGKEGWDEFNDSARDAAGLVKEVADDLDRLDKSLLTTSDDSKSAWSNMDTAARPFLATLGAIESAIAMIIAGWYVLSGDQANAKGWEAKMRGAADAAMGKGPGLPGQPGATGGYGPPAPPDMAGASAGGWGAPTVPTTTSYNPQIGGSTSSGSGYTPPDLTDAIQQNQLETQAQEENLQVTDKLTTAKDAAEQAEAKLTAAVKLAVTAAGEQSAQAALDTQKIIDLALQHQILSTAVANETRMLAADSAAHAEAATKYEAAKSALQSFTQAHAGAKNMSEADKETLEALKTAYQNVQQEWEKSGTVVRTLTEEIRQHREEMARDMAQEVELASASADAAATAQRAWNSFLVDQQQKLKDDLATFQMTNAQKVGYFASNLSDILALAQRNEAELNELTQEEVAAVQAGNLAKVASTEQAMAQISASIVQEYNLAKQYDEDGLSAYKETLQQQVDAAKQALDQEKQDVESVLDDMITEHKTFASELKSIFESIEKAWANTMAEMLVKSGWFQSIAHAFGEPSMPGGATGSTPDSAQLQQAYQSLQSAGAQLQQSATQGGQAATQTSQSATQTSQAAQALDQSAQALDQAAQAVGTAARAASAGAPSSDSWLANITQGAGSDSDATDANNPLATLRWISNISQGTYTYPLYVAESPGGAFETLASLGASSGSEYDAIDAFNPYGAASASESQAVAAYGAPAIPQVPNAPGVAGSLLEGYGLGTLGAQVTGGNTTFGGLGGLLGGGLGLLLHANPLIGMGIDLLTGIIGGLFGNHETPEEEPDIYQPGYGQFVSNMIGTYGTYNGQYVAAQAPYNSADGGTPEGKQVFEELAELPKNLSPAIEGLASQLRGLENGDTNANALEIASEYQGMFTLESGAQVSVQQYMNEIKEFMSETADLIPTFTISRTYPNLNISHLHRHGDQYPDESTSGSSSSSSSGADSRYNWAGNNGPLIHLDLSGASITGPGGLQAIIAELEALLQRAQQGQIPGTYANAFTSNLKWPWPS